MSVTAKEIVFPSNPADRKIISDSIHEIVSSLTRQQAEKDLIKEIGAEIKDKYDIPPAMLKGWANDAYDLAKKAEKDAKHEIIETGFQLFVATDKRLTGVSTGITVEEVAAREAAKKEEEERERLAKVQEAKEAAEKAKQEEIDRKAKAGVFEDDSVEDTVDEIIEDTVNETKPETVVEEVKESVVETETVDEDLFDDVEDEVPFETETETTVEETTETESEDDPYADLFDEL